MARFSWLDYSLFALYLAVSVGVGLWSARRKSGNLGDYFLAGRGMNSILIAMSILAALFLRHQLSGRPGRRLQERLRLRLRDPRLLHRNADHDDLDPAKVLPSRYFTAYQFLEERFALPVRLLASGLFIFRVSLWLAAATYAPALALEKVTGIPLWATILASGTLTTLYTALGGMRAVIWTDVIQLIVLFGGQLVIALVARWQDPGRPGRSLGKRPSPTTAST